MKTNRTLIIAMILCLASQMARATYKNENSLNRGLILDVYYQRDLPKDTLTLKLYDLFVGNVPLGNPQVITAIRNTNGKFHFEVPTKKQYGYFELSAKGNSKLKSNIDMSVLYPQFWERGDSLKVIIASRENIPGYYKHATFSGRGSLKYTARNTIYNLPYLDFSASNLTSSTRLASYATLSKDAKRKLDILGDFQQQISPLSYEILKADICFQYRSIFFNLKDTLQKADKADKSGIQNLKSSFQGMLHQAIDVEIPDFALENSAEYLRFVYDKVSANAYLEGFQQDLGLLFNTIIDKTNGLTRDAMLMYFFTTERNTIDVSEHFSRAEEIMQQSRIKEMLSDLRMILPGWTLADYELTDVNGGKVKLSGFNDKVVLLDFWGGGCASCAYFYKNTLSKIEEDFIRNDDLIIISISVDTRMERWKEGIKSGNFTNEHTLNLFTNGKGFSHPLTTDQKIKFIPLVILLDKGRRVKYFNTQNLYDYEGLHTAITETLQQP